MSEVIASDGRLAASAKQHTTTVALVPPEAAWPPIQAARLALRDQGLYRWPPHINLIYPFLPPTDFGAAVSELAPAVAGVPPFEITCDTLACFGGRARGVLYTHPSSADEVAALRRLQAALQAALPFCDEQQRQGTFTPHLTISHFASREQAEAARAALSPTWVPVTFQCGGAVHVMRREGGGGQFERACTLPLGGGGAAAAPRHFDPPLRFESMLSEEPEWMRQARRDSFKRSGGTSGGKRGRRTPRRSAEERDAIRARTPEQIAEIRAQRAAKKATGRG